MNKYRDMEMQINLSVCKNNGHDSSTLHDPWEWVPHKTQEFQNLALLFQAIQLISSILQLQY